MENHPSTPRSTPFQTGLGVLMLVVGLSVFLIRFQHAGPYAFPQRGNLLSGILALAIGAALLGEWLRGTRLGARIRLAMFVASPVVLFFALYATLAELEEVVVLRAPDASGEVQSLRLWVVDHDGDAWVTMPRSKAEAHGLTEAKVELLRNGVLTCVIARRDEDRSTVDRIFRLRYERYAIQRLATAIGVFGRSPSPKTVTLRLSSCAETARDG